MTRSSPLSVLATGLAWSALSARLYIDGHVPSRPPPYSGADHYLWQAIAATPLLWLQWHVAARAARWALRSEASLSDLRAAIAQPFARPVLWCLVVPDAVIYWTRGFSALAAGVRVYGPLALLISGAWTWQRLYTATGTSRTAAARAAACTLAAAWTLGGLVFR